MAKRFLFIVCALGALILSAQNVGGGSSELFSTDKVDRHAIFGIRGGLNISNYGFASNTLGGNIGLNVDIPILHSFYAQTGLYYTIKGVGVWDGGSLYINYLEMPILGSYRYNINPDVQLQASAGPFIAVKVASFTTYDDYDEWGNDLKTMDFGLQFGTGVTYKKLFFGVAYDLGLVKVFKDDGAKGNTLMFNVGYNF